MPKPFAGCQEAPRSGVPGGHVKHGPDRAQENNRAVSTLSRAPAGHRAGRPLELHPRQLFWCKLGSREGLLIRPHRVLSSVQWVQAVSTWPAPVEVGLHGTSPAREQHWYRSNVSAWKWDWECWSAVSQLSSARSSATHLCDYLEVALPCCFCWCWDVSSGAFGTVVSAQGSLPWNRVSQLFLEVVVSDAVFQGHKQMLLLCGLLAL